MSSSFWDRPHCNDNDIILPRACLLAFLVAIDNLLWVHVSLPPPVLHALHVIVLVIESLDYCLSLNWHVPLSLLCVGTDLP